MTQFSPEQESVIHTWGLGMAVLAGAGSGKTTTLVAKCEILLRNHPEARFAAVSFTERSANDLKIKLSSVLTKNRDHKNLSNPLDQHWVTTIHGLCASILREYPREAGLEGEEQILSETEAQVYWTRALESLWLEDLPVEVERGLTQLLKRESRSTLSDLLKRAKDLVPLGLLRVSALEGNENLQLSADQKALEKVTQFVLNRFQRLKKRQGYLDFSDLELLAYRTLRNESVQRSYHQKFGLILVDEFQDTNPLQAKIIAALAKPDRSNLCVVGDPKQSIYRFRDADVTIFEEFCSQLPVQKYLTWNFRSVPEILQFTNELCQKVFEGSNLKFEPLIPQRKNSELKESVVRLDISGPDNLGKWILNQVELGIPLENFVLLLRKIRGNEHWLKALGQCGIPIALGSGGLFWEDPRVRELVAFLKWWDLPHQTLSGAVFLRSPWVGIPDLILDQWVKRDPTFHQPFFYPDPAESSVSPVMSLLKPFLGQVVRPGELLLALLQDAAIEEELGAQALALWHRVELLSARGLDFHEVVREVSTSVREKRREREVPAPRHQGQLTVLTLHSAKGLEFPQVIMVDFNGKTRSPDAPLLYWDRQEGAYLAGRTEEGERDRTSPIEEKWRELEKKKNLEESNRLFYVGLTRARERLILVCQKDIGRIESETPFQHDDWRSWLETRKEMVRYDADQIPSRGRISLGHKGDQRGDVMSVGSLLCDHSKRTEFRERGIQKKRPRHSVTELTLLSRCPRAYEWTYVNPLQPASPVPLSGIVDTVELQKKVLREEFQALGNQIHHGLATGDYLSLKQMEIQKVAQSSTVRDFDSRPLIEWIHQSPWMKSKIDPEMNSKMISKNDGISNALDEVWTELAFEVPLVNGSEVLVGSMDRVIRFSEGAHYKILDFKVSERYQSKASLLKSYQTQMELYALALKKLEPQVKSLSADLVVITSSGVQVVPVRFNPVTLESDSDSWIQEANSILQGVPAIPRPGSLCAFCEFREHCPEGTIEYQSKDQVTSDRVYAEHQTTLGCDF